MFKIITSDLKGNHTYCKPKCKNKMSALDVIPFASH